MKYTICTYVKALLDCIENKSEQERKENIRRFLSFLQKNKDLSKLPAIVREFEKKYLNKIGFKKVYLESASPVSEETINKIQNILGKDIFFIKKINYDLLAGIKILINDEFLIDSTAKRHLNNFFKKI